MDLDVPVVMKYVGILILRYTSWWGPPASQKGVTLGWPVPDSIQAELPW
jgi:hypothetical protein